MTVPGARLLRRATGVEHLSSRLDRRFERLEQRLKRLDKRLRISEQNASRQIGTLDYDAAELRIGVTTRMELLSRVRPRHKEPWTVEWLERTIGHDDVLWDVGANVGAYSLIAASLGEGTRIVSIEPAPANYAALCENVTLNGFGPAIVPLPVALTSRTGIQRLALSDGGAGAAVHVLGSGDDRAQPVLAYTLDELLRSFELPTPTLLKIDVDGGELEVLRGATECLSSASLRSILAEVDRELTDEVTATLAAAGYQLVTKIDSREGKPMPLIWYGIFERDPEAAS